MDNKKQKDELMEKVFGKNAKNRLLTSSDLDILNNASTSFSNELDKLLEKSNQENKQLDELLNVCDNIVNTSTKISKTNNDDLEALRQNIINDFGSNVENINISYKQVELYEIFNKIEEELNKKILGQNKYNADLCKAMRRPYVKGMMNNGLNSATLICGEENTGRHSSIETITKLLKENNLIQKDKISIIDLSKYASKEDENNFIVDNYGAISNSEIIVFDHIESIEPYYLNYLEEITLEAKLSLSKRYALNNGQLTETSNTLIKNSIDALSYKGKYLFYITNLKQTKLINVLGSRFINNLSDIVCTNPLSKDNIAEIIVVKGDEFKNKCLSNLNIECNFSETFINELKENYDNSNVKYVIDIYEKIYRGLSEYKLSNPSDEVYKVNLTFKDNEIIFNDNQLSKYLPTQIDNQIIEVKKELDNIVGLHEVKNYIYSLQDFYAAQKLKQAQGLKTSEVSKHMIFTGNPGTGKTTIARLLAKYLKAIGVLSNGQLIEVTRSDLVGKYVGHTAPLTMQVINSAMGGILFIDEAYSLYRGENDSFGLECIDTLVKAMEDNRDDLIVILAGYTKEMKEFLNANSGLLSRFPNQIEFPDYTGEELYEIARINANNAGYKLEDKCKDDLIAYFNKAQSNDSQRSGNGRLARNIVEKAIIKQSSRILKDNGQIDLLKQEDFTY